jgi:hypothetical protein
MNFRMGDDDSNGIMYSSAKVLPKVLTNYLKLHSNKITTRNQGSFT